ncbi:MAG: NRDE family protein [Gemmataceae bacterium]
MCLLAILYRVAGDAPVVVAANREEFYARGGDPPRRLDGVPAVGGVDPHHGGTWLGVNRHGVLVAVTNRRKSTEPAVPRSRGLLVRDLLAQPSAAEATAAAITRAGDGQPCRL